jgi:pilus assembly protein FimV
MTRSPFLLAPIMAALLMHSAQAITLGELQLKSYIGQKLKADIPYHLNADERLFEGCYQILPSSNDISYIGGANVQIVPQGDGSNGVIRIAAQQVAEEPMLGFALRIECETLSLTRDFTIFLDPAPIVDVPVVAVAKSNSAVSSTGRNRKLTTLNKSESLQDIAAKYYPNDPKEYQRYLDRLKKSNPNIAEDDVLPIGTEVSIPGRRKAATVQPNANHVMANNEQGRLRLESEDKPSAGANPAAYVKELEAKVLELSELRRKLQIEIDALDQRLAQSQASMPAAIAATSAARVVAAASVVQAAPVAPAAPVASAVVNKPVRSQEKSSSWQWPSIGLLSILGLGTWWWLQRRRDDEEMESPDSVLTSLKTNFFPRRGTQQTLGGATMHHMNTGFEVLSEDDQGMDQVQYFLAQGETLRAIELLQQLLRDDPLDTERWLMLFRVYRQQGMKSDYIQLAQKFKAQTPAPEEDDWELVRSIGYKLAPECELFIREERVNAKENIPETPVDLAISSLLQSSQNVDVAPANTVVEKAQALNDVDLIQFLQPIPTAAQSHHVAHTLPEEKIEIELPKLTELREDTKDLSSLEQLKFDIEELQFDDEKSNKK